VGKTSKPITIVAIGDVALWEELEKLKSQGHKIISLPSPDVPLESVIEEADVVLGPNCWRMDPAHRDYLPLAIKEARMLRYSHEDRHDKKKRAAAALDIGLEPESDDLSIVPGDS